MDYKKRRTPFLFTVLCIITLCLQSCKQKTETTAKGVSLATVDSTAFNSFFESYPELKEYQEAYEKIYDHYDQHFIWFNEKGMVDYAESLYKKVENIDKEGIFTAFPYQKEIDELYENPPKNPEKHTDEELLMTGLYTFYMGQVYKGLDADVTEDLDWLLTKKDLEDTDLLDSIISGDEWEENDSLMIGQYYKLRDKLKEYRAIKDDGGWTEIEGFEEGQTFEPSDSSSVIRQIRNRLYAGGELKKNNESKVYDEELKKGIINFQKHHGFNRDSVISGEHIEALNVPIKEYIKKIVLNLERLRWIPPEMNGADELIFVNIPAYHLNYYRDGDIIFDSDVVVGKVMTETVIFDGEMSFLNFSPYWNIPESIIEEEIKPGMEEDDDYLEKHNMEWNDGQVRQKPGKDNSLGLVKFMFPNSNDIYLHDTPSKWLFEKEERANSHGCIRVEDARDLAVTIMDQDDGWESEKVDSAMSGEEETTYNLKEKIPVYIGYFTTWVDENDEIYFYKDIYKRDDNLADILFNRQE